MGSKNNLVEVVISESFIGVLAIYTNLYEVPPQHRYIQCENFYLAISSWIISAQQAFRL